MAAFAEMPGKAPARVALLGVDVASAAILADCFCQFGITTVLATQAAEVATGCDGCVLPLRSDTTAMLRAVREAAPHAVIYGLCGSLRDAVRYSEHGINAVFEIPVQRSAALAVVRATHLLVLHELRRYVRVPLVAGVGLDTGAGVLQATSMELSAGGMSLTPTVSVPVGQMVLASFDLPGAATINVRAIVCWQREHEDATGIRFDPDDPHRAVIRRWIDDYLCA